MAFVPVSPRRLDRRLAEERPVVAAWVAEIRARPAGFQHAHIAFEEPDGLDFLESTGRQRTCQQFVASAVLPFGKTAVAQAVQVEWRKVDVEPLAVGERPCRSGAFVGIESREERGCRFAQDVGLSRRVERVRRQRQKHSASSRS